MTTHEYQVVTLWEGRPSGAGRRPRPSRRWSLHPRQLWRLGQRVALLGALPLIMLTAGCGANLPIPNPFAAEEPTPVPTRPAAAPAPAQAAAQAPTLAPPPPTAPATVAAQPTPAFTPFWVKNHRITEMWSGPTAGPGVVSFGMTSQQFCSFQVVLPQDGPRLFVFNPYTQNYLWIDADAVGPVGAPERRAGPPPAGQNCAEAIHAG